MTRDTGIAALLGLGAALPLCLALWGFTVDDALITARMASHLAAGHGYRFNVGGPVVDAVTPLGFAHLLALLGPAEPLAMLERARWLGLVAWLGAAAYLGVLLGRPTRRTLTLLGLIALSAPLGAWASAGMETGFVTALCTLALRQGPLGGLAAGLSAGLRPELVPWAVTLTIGRSAPTVPGRIGAALLALGPALLVALVRSVVFGTPTPLSLAAKAPDLDKGLFYASFALLQSGIPLLLLAPRALVCVDREGRALAAALGAHFVALILAGGDWMPLFRLLVPVLPTALLAAVKLAPHAGVPWFYGRALLAAGFSLQVLVVTAWSGRSVHANRTALIERARPLLAGAERVATPDAGWVGAATPGPVLDLAGVTDPAVAMLPGGHTSKRIPEVMLTDRGADVWTLLLAPGTNPADDWTQSSFYRWVDQHLAGLPLAGEFELVATLPAGGPYRYIVVRRSRAGRGRAPGALP
jgi:hypothetical protein